MVLFLLVLLIGPGAPVLQPPAGAAGPDDNGAARQTADEVAETLARAAILYRQFKSREALTEIEKALVMAPDHPEVLIWAARTSIDLGDLIPETVPDREKKRIERYRAAERYARTAVKGRHGSTWPHFFLAVALGKLAEFSDINTQITMAREIRKQADRAIALDPDNGFAYHVLGVWHRRLAEINKVERLLVQLFLQESVPAGRLNDSARYLEKAIQHNPDIITHHLELAKTYQTLGKMELAREHLITVDKLPVQFSDDGLHKRNAKKLLEDIERNGSGCHERC